MAAKRLVEVVLLGFRLPENYTKVYNKGQWLGSATDAQSKLLYFEHEF